jgi:ferredoxin
MIYLVSVPPVVSPTASSKRTTIVACVHIYKDAMLGRFYAICNCCSCCCGAMEAQRNGTMMLASSGYVAVVDEDLCAGCGTCADVCQFAAISVDDGFAAIDAAACMGCGVCVAHRPQEAISLLRDATKGEPLEIQKLIAEAATAVQV